MVLSVEEYSSTFFVRLNGKKRNGFFDNVNIPEIEGFKCFSYLQYNTRTKKFRVVKITSKDQATIYDDKKAHTTKYSTFKKLLNDHGWVNYICEYKAKQQGKVFNNDSERIPTPYLPHLR